MAVIATYTAVNGARVRVFDDCLSPPGSDEERRAIEAQRRAAFAILSTYAEREDQNDNHPN